jgi:multidrug efflux pump subunit AcrB
LIRWSKFYERYIRFTQKRKGIYFAILILAFGIPFYALPGKWEKKQAYYLAGSEKIPWYQAAYNATFGSLFFQNTLKEPISKIFGGSMRLFASKLDSRTYAEKERDIILTVRAQMPLGGSIHHLNEKVARLEKFLARFDEIKRFETRVESTGARVTVEFKDEHEKTYFPYYLENLVIGEVLSIGGADWSTSGVSPRGFSNSLNLGHRSDRIILSGYNYLRLYKYAEEISATLSQNRRVNDLIIENVQGKEVEEMYLDFDRHRIALYQFNVGTGYRALQELLTERNLGRFTSDFITGDLVLKSSQMDRFDVWHLLNSYVKAGDRNFPLSAFGQIGQRTAKNSIPKKNQEYTLTVSFNYIGSYESRNKYVNEVIEHYNEKVFPVGYHCENSSYGWYKDDGTQYWLILSIVVIIFFLCAILFESLGLPLVIISLIPVSFIGTFLTFYFSGINFGTGGFASLVLLCGIVVNSGIYVVNEYKDTRLRNQERGLEVSRLKMYLKAYNHKIIPVFLTVLSTVLGLVPFFIDSETDDFWFSFAVGTTGGLLFSIVALVFVMPIFMPLIKRNRPRRKG